MTYASLFKNELMDDFVLILTYIQLKIDFIVLTFSCLTHGLCENIFNMFNIKIR